jgi:hypothetical protein
MWMIDINKQERKRYPCNNKKGRRFQIHLKDELVKDINLIKTKRDIPGSFQQTIYHMLNVYVHMEKYGDMIKEDPTFLYHLQNMNSQEQIMDIIHDYAYDERQLINTKHAIERLLEWKSFKK